MQFLRTFFAHLPRPHWDVAFAFGRNVKAVRTICQKQLTEAFNGGAILMARTPGSEKKTNLP